LGEKWGKYEEKWLSRRNQILRHIEDRPCHLQQGRKTNGGPNSHRGSADPIQFPSQASMTQAIRASCRMTDDQRNENTGSGIPPE
jgi:hypothetical protein